MIVSLSCINVDNIIIEMCNRTHEHCLYMSCYTCENIKCMTGKSYIDGMHCQCSRRLSNDLVYINCIYDMNIMYINTYLVY